MKQLRLVTFTLLLLVPGVVMLLGAYNEAAPAEKPIVLKYGTMFPDTVHFTIADLNALKKIEKETNGRVAFKTYTGGSLITMAESVAMLESRVCDIVHYAPEYGPGFDILKASRQFYVGSNVKTSRRIYNEVREKFPEIDAELAGSKVLCRATSSDLVHLFTKEAVRSLGDLKGLQIKTLTALLPVFKELGAEGIKMSTRDVYVSLQKGIIDGLTLDFSGMGSYKFYEVAKYGTRLDYLYGPLPLVAMNWDCWNALPSDVQKVFEDNIEWWGLETERLASGLAARGLEDCLAAGMKYNELEPEELARFYELAATAAREAAEKLDAKGLPGTKYLDEVQRLIEKYNK